MTDYVLYLYMIGDYDEHVRIFEDYPTIYISRPINVESIV